MGSNSFRGKLEGAASEADEEEAAAPDAGNAEEAAASEAGTSAEAGTACTFHSEYR